MWHEERLALIEKHCLKMFEQLPLAVLIVDSSGRPLYMNRLALNLLGKGLEEIGSRDRVGDLPKVFMAYVAGTDTIYPGDRTPLAKALTASLSR